jgi:hypothetical protein
MNKIGDALRTKKLTKNNGRGHQAKRKKQEKPKPEEQ